MLPGLRFLFIAVVLSISVLVFGLGAASLMRAAHQEFAGLPSRPRPAERVFGQAEIVTPSLAMLRVEPQIEEERTLEVPATDITLTDAPSESSPVAATTASPSEVAIEAPAVSAAAAPEADIAPQVQAAETVVSNEPVPVETAPSPVETTVATIETAPQPSPDQTPTVASDQTKVVAPLSEAISTKIAALGSPPAEIETPASPIKQARSKTRAAEAKKRLRAEREIKRRKAARRARALRASQTPADPFGAQPFGGFSGVAPRTQ